MTLSLRGRGAAVVFSAAVLASSSALPAAPEPYGMIDMASVLKPGPLPELAIGDPNGIVVVEYGSLACPHCASFKETLLELRKEYVDLGKVRYIFREFSPNTLNVAGFVLARCLGDDKALAADELLFSEQDKWAFVDKPLEPLIAAIGPTGMTRQQAMQCLKNQTLADAIVAITKRAVDDIRRVVTLSATGSIYDDLLTVSAVSWGTIVNGMTISGAGIASTTQVVKQVTPLVAGESLGGIGRYIVSTHKHIVATTAISSTLSSIVTPTFVIDGKAYVGYLTFDQLKAILDPLVKNRSGQAPPSSEEGLPMSRSPR